MLTCGKLTVSTAEPEAVPPGPVQLSEKLSVPTAVGEIGSDPLTGWAPVQFPLAEHEVAFVDDHVTVADCPILIVVGLTEMVTVGAGAFTVNAAELVAVPPEPVQDRE